MAEIYALTDPRTGEVRYIGKANDAQMRFKGHMRDRARRDYPVYRWINKLVRNGLTPGLVILEKTDDWKSSERRLIELSRARGDRLLNVADGGDQPMCSQEQRTANAIALNDRLRTNPQLARIRHLKRWIGDNIRSGLMSNFARLRLRAGAEAYPEIYGTFASIPFIPQEGTHGRRI